MTEPPERPLRHGYTTGSCAAAATKAAVWALVHQQPLSEVEIGLPAGQRVRFAVEGLSFTPERAACAVIKDGGDDPDATHGAWIWSTVSWRGEPGIELEGGEGVGRVTKPGLAVPVGEPAINPVPRRMIRQAAEEAAGPEMLGRRGMRVVISVPGGEEIAKKTMNGRLGIIGGISILGTTGIVKPFSTAAWMASVAQAISVATAAGCRQVVLTTGGRSEKVAMRELSHLPEEAFIEMGDFLGFSLKQCAKRGVEKVTLCGMIGKFSKAAAGHMHLHSKGSSVDPGWLADLAVQSGVPPSEAEGLRRANTAKEIGDVLWSKGYHAFFSRLCEEICARASEHVGGAFGVEMILCDFEGRVIGRGERPWNRSGSSASERTGRREFPSR
ncbi:cobalt-precorrin-5B (C(1))-methyltransferase [Kyrpidia tusciae]|uniref:Cobalt-precorrin-5B C(1)-methyltransferase n=1 Tax=Kyrpidia tusciae (strain DSM 2912 / NBRC 15312 / T2) TaxID=562970 RepID=D5WT70_KYRT2|nr:cobalt-precorrin-5B (C(1))-methyltransferase [Kyrpidia tusciae]ADG05174.1 cobalamin biosynthesis protein CbiD [Kyrpidia tusciae DSM 2912]